MEDCSKRLRVEPGGTERMQMTDLLDGFNYIQSAGDRKYALKRKGLLPQEGLVGWNRDKVQNLFHNIWRLNGWTSLRAQLPDFDSPSPMDSQKEEREEFKTLVEGLKQILATAKTLKFM
jgi:hypothetical protein